MVKRSIPTKEQLEKLSKVSGIKLFYKDSLCPTYRKTPKLWYVKWQPHLDMNQIAMVIKELTVVQQNMYDNLMSDVWTNTAEIKIIYYGIWLQIVHPSISCEKLLEVLK